MANEVDIEKKKQIYEPCIKYFSEKYSVTNWEVIGLLFGARGTLTKFCINVFSRFNIHPANLQDIALNILRDSLHIVQFHLYGLNEK